MYLLALSMIWFTAIICPSESRDRNVDLQLMSQGMEEFILTGTGPTYLAEILKSFFIPNFVQDEKRENPELCYLCNLVVDLVILQRTLGVKDEHIANEGEYMCVTLGISSERVCAGIVDLNKDIFFYIMDHYANFTSDRICGTILQAYGCPAGESFEWSVDLPKRLRPPKSRTTSDDRIKILQLTDVHYDPNYMVGGIADCNEFVCCQTDQGSSESAEGSCGYWTDYKLSDVPWHLIEETVRQTRTHDINYVYFTGDIISHRIWQTSEQTNAATIWKFYTYLRRNFDVPVFPIFGNHEPHPLDVWPPEIVVDKRFTEKWLFDLASDAWSLLTGVNVQKTVMKGGYYTVSPRPGFRIIAINSNLCYTFNWWLIYDDADPYGQLKWLVDTLKQAEENNEKVHILSHVPTGSGECLKVWGREYARIVERFSDTITGQFNGHTHKDEFHVFYNRSNATQPVGAVFNGAAITPYTLGNPSYKIYSVDSSSFSLLDYEEWTFNLTLANSKPNQSPDWYKLYSFVDAYQVASLDPVEVDKVLYKMAENHSILDTYFKYKYRNSDVRGDCDESCRKTNLCEISTSVFEEVVSCNHFLDLYEIQN